MDKVILAVLGVALVGGGIYLATRRTDTEPARDNAPAPDAPPRDQSPIGAILGFAGTLTQTVRDIRVGDQQTERARLGTRTDATMQRTGGESLYASTSGMV